MIQSLESLLASYQRWRHFGETILFVGIFGEIAVIAFIDWRFRELPVHLEDKARRVICEVFLTALILIGVGVENWAGGRADDVIRQMRAPRYLIPAQRSDITRALLRFSGTHFDFSVEDSPEAVDLMHQIAESLKNAGWVRQPLNGATIGYTADGPIAGIALFQGLELQIAATQKQKLQAALVALAQALKDAGLTVTNVAEMPDNRVPADGVHILIGLKPE